jgi:hypothetical protein
MAWNSLSYADAGEMLTHREKRRLLGKAGLFDQKHGHTAERMQTRAVAVQVGESLTRRVLDYAIETCDRLRAELVLLTHGPGAIHEHAVANATQRIREAGIHTRVVRLTGEWDQALTRYVRAHHEIIFVILNALDANSHALLAQRHTRKRHNFPVPLVVVDENPTRAI